MEWGSGEAGAGEWEAVAYWRLSLRHPENFPYWQGVDDGGGSVGGAKAAGQERGGGGQCCHSGCCLIETQTMMMISGTGHKDCWVHAVATCCHCT